MSYKNVESNVSSLAAHYNSMIMVIHYMVMFVVNLLSNLYNVIDA